MKNYQDKVKEFHIASGQQVDLKRDLTNDELDFRDSLIKEEIRELVEAVVDNNRVEILDALCDIKYVNDGTANMLSKIQNDLFYEDCYQYTCCKNIHEIIDKLKNINTIHVGLINIYVYELAYLFNFSLENFKTALDRVHESNMSKFCYDTKTVERTQEFYANQGIETYI